MRTKELIKKHERCIELLDAIEAFNKRISLNREAAFFAYEIGLNPNKHNHNIEIQKKCIVRLLKLYLQELDNLTEK